LLPLAVHHATDEDVAFRGFTIPKDTMVLLNLHSIHWDPKLWPNPHVFDPLRFLDDNGRLIRKEELGPFSLGKLGL
jgi:cytochrome P450 family 2 subfamily U polypeptide 1